MKNIHISKNLEALSLSFADWIVTYAEEILKKKGNLQHCTFWW